MQVTQFCKRGCLLNEKAIYTGTMQAMSLCRGQLMLGKQHLSERCPSCGKIAVWIIEEEPRRTTAEAQKEQTAV